ncbi:MAG: carbohydrate kinase family protein [Patescibacteria group bacterium]
MSDFIAIGETTIDVFIKLENINVDPDHSKICLPFATKVPYEFAVEVPAVGNASNAVVTAARLGLNSALVANIGNDANGEKCLEVLKAAGVSTKYIGVQDDKKTNYHYVLWYENDRTILQKHSNFQYSLPNIGSPRWLYLTSLGENSIEFHTEIIEYLNDHFEIKLAFQPGIFQIKLGKEQLKDIYQRTEIFFSNVEEAETILGIETLGIQGLIKRMHDLGPKIVVITDGPKGAYAYDGTELWFQSPYPDPKPPYERTGAGDALASTTVAALAFGLNLDIALKWGMINAMSVIQEIGAQKGLLSRSQIEEYLKSAPLEFQTKKLN